MMNQNTNNNAQAQATITLTEAVVELTQLLKEAISLAKEEEAASTTATETTATTTTETTATEATETTTATTPIVVIDDDDNVIATSETTTETTTADEEDNTEFKGSMIEQNPMDLIPAAEAKADTAVEAKADDTAEAEETVPADDEAAEEYLDNISCDISTLYDISTYTLENEGYNIGTDHSPYAPMDNRSASFDNYKVYISKEIIKGETEFTGEFRMIVSEKNSGVKILDHSLKIINDHVKVFSSENTVRMDKIKDSKKLFRLMEIVEEVSALVMSKYSK